MSKEPIKLARRLGQESSDTAWHRLKADMPELKMALGSIDAVDAVTVAALIAEDTRPRCLPHGSGALLILRGVNTEPGADPEDMVSPRLWIDTTKVVTFQVRHLDAVDVMAREIEAGNGPDSPGEFVVALTDRLTDRMQEVIESVDTALDGLEDEQSLKPVPMLRKEITEIRRKIVLLRRFIAPQRDALDVLIAETFDWQTELQERRLTDIVDRITRLVEQLDTMQLRASILQDFVSVRVTERLNKTMVLLSIVAGVFLPLSFVAGLFGMNVAGIPLATQPFAFLWISVGLLVVGLGALFLLLKLWPR
ncbi:CorA family divalent cation transporter [Roseovarius rhodophyticola]|uniref:CorA family divalent cation transporter n=1 Tax=Roseovarius rhodophyticola TaxID=3080827 RepID=A0ABZ2TEL3_9RHOB|nr:CorA family divalent cation transporter [Roseovarius sp. W115]MDV2928414.1 CorA family divalent cation transporter [Roseovarius sp. W115]